MTEGGSFGGVMIVRMTPRMMPSAPVGSSLREARIAAGLTIEQLAVSAGVGGATVERIEHGRVKPHRATLLALALALSAPYDSEAAGGNRGFAQTVDAGDGQDSP